MFPLKNYEHQLPTGDDLGAFGTPRKFDVHTGIDLYTTKDAEVFAIEDGEVVAIEWFTGKMVNMPWWNDTQAIAIKGKSGVINYGEVQPHYDVVVGDLVKEGDHIGWITPVLKKDKGVVPSTSMLHLELYSEYNGKWEIWNLGKDKPKNLYNPYYMLLEELPK
jgi:murein DD-endopeptidase MepM/ murein hydrolase activator NlpD